MCVAVCDESRGSQSPNRPSDNEDWLPFRSNWPDRPYFILQLDNYDFADLELNANAPIMVADINNTSGNTWETLTSYFQVSRDNGSTNTASDWFNICSVESHYNDPSFRGNREIFLFVDNSGSMTTSSVQASIELFLSNCENAAGGPIEVYAVVNPSENFVDPFITWNGALVTTYSELAALA